MTPFLSAPMHALCSVTTAGATKPAQILPTAAVRFSTRIRWGEFWNKVLDGRRVGMPVSPPAISGMIKRMGWLSYS